MTEEKKKWTIEEILSLYDTNKRQFIERTHDKKGGEIYQLVRLSTDLVGHTIEKAWKKTNGEWQEIELEPIRQQIAEKVLSHVNSRLILKDTLQKEDAKHLLELAQSLEGEAKIYPSLQKGSCFYLHIHPKNGRKKSTLQITT